MKGNLRKILVIFLGTIIALELKSNIYATTSFDVSRKSLKIYEKFDISQIITTDSKDNLKYTISDSSVADISEDGIIFTKGLGEFSVTVTDGTMSDTCNFSSGYYVGIDVSSFNGEVEWDKVKNQGIDFAMIRSSLGWYDEELDKEEEYDFQFDKQFLNNLKGASENNMSFGIYHFCLATNAEEAEQEAIYVLNALNEYGKEYKENMTLPIAYDIEGADRANLGMKKVTEIAIAFCNKIYEAGYTPIIYSNRDFFTNYLDLDKLNALAYNYWYASPKDEPDFSEKITIADTKLSPIMWQYTFEGSVDGADNDQGNVDMDIMYMNDRVKVEVIDNGQVVDIIGANKNGAIDYIPQYAKEGYIYNGIEDKDGNLINEEYKFNEDSKVSINYTKIPITSLILNTTELNFSEEKEQYIVISSVLPDTAVLDGEDIMYSSDNEDIATVDENGKVIPVSNGSCNIVCKLKSNPEVQAVCKIKVHFGLIIGDLDNSGAVNSDDAAIALDLYRYGNATDEDILIGDIDENGIINSDDAALILDIYRYGK